ncbi:MAG TPA: hypothetical protein VK689_02530, partial [Armatimonadota bacterium]|nr:hypothetical protein [Armatimonadota bacterium]
MRSLVLLPLLLCAAFPCAAAAASARAHRVTPPFPWARDLGAAPRIPLVGDVNGDGYADLLSLSPRGKCRLDVAFNGRGVKSLPPRGLLDSFGEECVAATCANVDGQPGDEVVALFADGSVRVGRGLGGEKPEGVVWGALQHPVSAPAWLAVRADGRGPCTLLVVHGDGALESAEWSFSASGNAVEARSPSRRAPFGLGARPVEVAIRPEDSSGRKRGSGFRIAWRDMGERHGEGLFTPGATRLQRRTEYGVDAGDLFPRTLLGLPSDRRGSSDVGLGEVAWTRPSVLLAGDISGDGTADLIRFRRDDEPHAGSDVLVYLGYREGDPDPDADGLTLDEERVAGADPLRRDTDNDGLPDGWEVKGWEGFDLKALGCRPGRADLLVRLQRVADLNEESARAAMERARGYFAGLPVTNPDGTRGIALHVVFDPAIPVEKARGRGWWAVGDEFFPERLRGAWHWMLAPNAGGGQSDMLADRGSAGGRALYATFIHEFGHQLGLPHEGFWPGGWCPAYPSLMNYAYSYQLGGRPDAIGYSPGKLAGIVFDERDLSERLPLKYNEVAFLAGPPYGWRLKAEGDHTLIDWNWNGVFGEEHVRADINYGYSTTAGTRQILMPERCFDEQDRTGHAPFLVTHRGRLLLFHVEAPRDAKADESMTPEERKAAKPLTGRVMVRLHQEDGAWSPPVPVSPRIAKGDPYAVSHAGRLWLFYPTEAGIEAAPLSDEGGAAGSPVLTSGTEGASVSALSSEGRLLLFFWRGPEADVTWAEWNGSAATQERSLGFRSTTPVGPCVDTLKNRLLLGCSQDQDERRPSRWIVRRFGWKGGEDAELEPQGLRWVMGEAGSASGNRRPTLLFEDGADAGADGRLHFIATGMVTDATRKSCYYSYVTIQDRTVNHGWLQRRYYDEWTESAS